MTNKQPVKFVFAKEDISERNHYPSLTQIPETTKKKYSLIQTLRFLIKHLPLFSVQTVPGTTRPHSLNPYSTRSIINDDNDNYKYFKEKRWQRDTLGIVEKVCILWGIFYEQIFAKGCYNMEQNCNFSCCINSTEVECLQQILWIFWLTSCIYVTDLSSMRHKNGIKNHCLLLLILFFMQTFSPGMPINSNHICKPESLEINELKGTGKHTN